MAIFSNIRLLWISIIALIILNLITLGALWTTRSHRALTNLDKKFERSDKRGDGPEKYLQSHLKLNDDQVAKFKEIKIKQKEALDNKFSEIRGLREQLMIIVQKQDFNDSAKMIIDNISRIQSEVEKLNYDHFRELLNICDDSQKQIFIETMKKAFMPGHTEEFHNRKQREKSEDKK